MTFHPAGRVPMGPATSVALGYTNDKLLLAVGRKNAGIQLWHPLTETAYRGPLEESIAIRQVALATVDFEQLLLAYSWDNDSHDGGVVVVDVESGSTIEEHLPDREDEEFTAFALGVSS